MVTDFIPRFHGENSAGKKIKYTMVVVVFLFVINSGITSHLTFSHFKHYVLYVRLSI